MPKTSICKVFILISLLTIFSNCDDDDVKSIPITITSINPGQGCIEDLQPIQILGSNFQTIQEIEFGTIRLDEDQFVVNGTGDQLTIFPAQIGGLMIGEYTIEILDQTESSKTIDFTFNEDCAPRLIELLPDEGYFGDSITIRGKYFRGANLKVQLTTNSSQATALIFDQVDTLLSVVVPDDVISGPVTIQNDFGTSNELTFKVVQPDPDPPTLTTGEGTIAKGCLLSLEGHSLAPQGMTKLNIYQNSNLIQTLAEEDFIQFNDLLIQIRVTDDLPVDNLRFEVETDYGTDSRDLQLTEYVLEALEVIPQGNYIDGPFYLKKEGENIERILFDGQSMVPQEMFEEEDTYLAARVPSGVNAGPSALMLESSDGCRSEGLPFEVVNGTSPWIGSASSPNVIIPNPPPGVSIDFTSQGNIWKFAELIPNPKVYELNLSQTSLQDTSDIIGSVYYNGEAIQNGEILGSFFVNGTFLELNVDGKDYFGQLDDTYPFLSGPGLNQYTPRRYIMYPLQPGELAELIIPFLLESVEPSTFSKGDTIEVHGKYFPEIQAWGSEIKYFFYTPDGELFYENCYPNEYIWNSATSITYFLEDNPNCFVLPPGDYLFRLGKYSGGYRSNSIPVTIE